MQKGWEHAIIKLQSQQSQIDINNKNIKEKNADGNKEKNPFPATGLCPARRPLDRVRHGG